jgi:hypothetical protein
MQRRITQPAPYLSISDSNSIMAMWYVVSTTKNHHMERNMGGLQQGKDMCSLNFQVNWKKRFYCNLHTDINCKLQTRRSRAVLPGTLLTALINCNPREYTTSCASNDDRGYSISRVAWGYQHTCYLTAIQLNPFHATGGLMFCTQRVI